MKTFKLIDKTLMVAKEMDVYNSYRKLFSSRAGILRDEYKATFNKYSGLESMLGDFDNQYTNSIKQGIAEAIKILIGEGIYDVDENRYFSLLDEHGYLLKGDDAFSSIYEKYIEIEGGVEGAKRYRQARKDHRGRIIGGGFGLEGAVKGMATAGVMNLGIGALHSIGNAVGNMISKGIASSDKKKLFRDSKTYAALADAIYNDCYNVHVILVEILRQKGYALKNITQSEGERASTLFNTAKNPAFPKEKISDVMVEILGLYPYNSEYYVFLLNNFQNNHEQIEAIADYFGVSLREHKVAIVRDYYASLSISKDSSLDELLTAGEQVISFSKSIKGEVPEDVTDEIILKIAPKRYLKFKELFESEPKNSLDDIRRFYARVEEIDKRIKSSYSSNDFDKLNEDRPGIQVIFDKARKLEAGFRVELVQERLEDTTIESEEDALAAREDLLAYCKHMNIDENNPAIASINKTIQMFDLTLRPEEGAVFDVKLTNVGPDKGEVISLVRNITGLGVAQVVGLVNYTPSIICKALSKADAFEIVEKLANVGAKATLTNKKVIKEVDIDAVEIPANVSVKNELKITKETISALRQPAPAQPSEQDIKDEEINLAMLWYSISSRKELLLVKHFLEKRNHVSLEAKNFNEDSINIEIVESTKPRYRYPALRRMIGDMHPVYEALSHYKKGCFYYPGGDMPEQALGEALTSTLIKMGMDAEKETILLFGSILKSDHDVKYHPADFGFVITDYAVYDILGTKEEHGRMELSEIIYSMINEDEDGEKALLLGNNDDVAVISHPINNDDDLAYQALKDVILNLRFTDDMRHVIYSVLGAKKQSGAKELTQLAEKVVPLSIKKRAKDCQIVVR